MALAKTNPAPEFFNPVCWPIGANKVPSSLSNSFLVKLLYWCPFYLLAGPHNSGSVQPRRPSSAPVNATLQKRASYRYLHVESNFVIMNTDTANYRLQRTEYELWWLALYFSDTFFLTKPKLREPCVISAIMKKYLVCVRLETRKLALKSKKKEIGT